MTPFKLLYLDIEILQITLGDAWRTMGSRFSNMISFGYQWDHQTKPYTIDLIDTGEFDKLTPRRPSADKKLITEAHKIISEADIIVTHFGDKFDLKYLRGKFLKYDLDIPPTIEFRDTCMKARQKLKIGSNRLDSLAEFFGVTRKQPIDHRLWFECYCHNKTALRSISKYCRGDVTTLREVYQHMEELFTCKQHAGVALGHDKASCVRCGSESTKCSKTYPTAAGSIRRQMKCNNCGKYFTISNTAYLNSRG